MTVVTRTFPLLLWAAYAVAYPELQELVGGFAPLIGLIPAGVAGWAWGAIGGLAGALAGYVVLQLRAHGLDAGAFGITDTTVANHAFAVLSYGGVGFAVGWLALLTRNLKRERRISERAQVDPLTGTLARATFEERLNDELNLAEEQGRGLALLFVDLDRFKFVNDTFGHDIGDKLLREVGKVLRNNVRGNDLVGRVGGDEFMVALIGVSGPEAAGQVARSLVRELSAPMTVEEREIQVSASIGISLYPRDGTNAEELLHSADAAMYQVKQGGKNAYHFSTLEVRTRLSRRLELERKLRRALADNQLEIDFQPQVRLLDSALVGFEALLRWRSPELGLVSPSEFIPVAEDAGLIGEIGHWTIRECAMQQRAWFKQGLMPVRMSVNVSPLQFHQATFVDTVRGALNDSGIEPALLELEVTESVLVRDHKLAMRTLKRLERLGVSTALDDFGTGYSSLAYLERLPIDTLKIDRSFINGIVPPGEGRPESRSALGAPPSRYNRIIHPHESTSFPDASTPGPSPIVDAITAMAFKLDKHLVAEGVESAYQAEYLRRLGVHSAQGYFFSRPLAPLKAENLLRRVTGETLRAKEREARRTLSGTTPTPSEGLSVDGLLLREN